MRIERLQAPLGSRVWWALAGLFLVTNCAGVTLKGSLTSPFAPAGATDAAALGRRHALIIGINQFDDERFTPLKYAVTDADALGEALQAFDDVRILSTPATTRRAAVLAALAELTAKATRPSDTIVVYFSTHGSLHRGAGGELQRYIALSDTRLDLLDQTGLSVHGITSALNKIAARRKAVVLATCHSGKGKSQVPDRLARVLAAQKAFPRLEEVSEAHVVVTACAFGESAREDDALGHDVYTYYLLEALKRGDRDNDGAVTVSEAHDYARERTYEKTGGLQRPTSEADVLGRDPIILAGKAERVGKPILFSYSSAADGVEVRWRGQKKGTLPGGVAIEPGTAELELFDPQNRRTLFRGPVTLAEGEQIDLADALPQAVALDFGASVAATTPLSGAVHLYLPNAVGPEVTLGIRHLPWRWSLLRLTGGARFGGGRTPGLDAVLPYSFQAGHAAVGFGLQLPVGASFLIEGLGAAGPVVLHREFALDTFRSSETAWGATISGQLGVQWQFASGVALTTRAEAALLCARLGAPTCTPTGTLALGLSWTARPRSGSQPN